jgi:hypothetical protein
MGCFNICVQDAGGLTDEDFLKAKKEGCLDELLAGLPVDQEAQAENTATHMIVIAHFRKHLTGFPNGAYPMDRVNTSILHHITLLNWASEPYFAYWMSYYGTIHNPSGSVNTGNAGKRFYAHAIETYSEKDPTGREGVFVRSRWLYLPSQAVSNQIRAIGVYWGEYVNDNNEDKGMVAWARMKDAGGFPLTLDKSASQTLLIQYTFSWVAL